MRWLGVCSVGSRTPGHLDTIRVWGQSVLDIGHSPRSVPLPPRAWTSLLSLTGARWIWKTDIHVAYCYKEERTTASEVQGSAFKIRRKNWGFHGKSFISGSPVPSQLLRSFLSFKNQTHIRNFLKVIFSLHSWSVSPHLRSNQLRRFSQREQDAFKLDVCFTCLTEPYNGHSCRLQPPRTRKRPIEACGYLMLR